MKAALLLLLICFTAFTTKAQEATPIKAKYLNWIYFNNNQKAIKGVIIETDDSTLLFVDNSYLARNSRTTSYTPQAIPVSSIEKIKVRKRNDTGKGVLFGTLGGAALGAIAGYASGDDECEPGAWCIIVFSAEEKAGIGAVLGVLPGMALGALVGSARKTIHINGDHNVYSLSRDELRQYTLTKK